MTSNRTSSDRFGTDVAPPRVDLFSDTVTRPTSAMRAAMAEAEVGDEQRGEDPTVNRLRARVCELLGTEDAVFLPSGTMCNQISLRVHCAPGDEIITDVTAHVRHYESGGPAALSGVNITTVDGRDGVFSAQQLLAALRPDDNHFPPSRAVVLEQTANLPGGVVWPLDAMREVCDAAQANGLRRHLDGARLFNAVVAAGVPAADYCGLFDSVWIDFTKGLGAPVGAALAGSADFIRRAWRFKHQFGGAMRQSGVIAAASLHALDHHIDRLADDHNNARRFADAISGAPGLTVEPVHTNMVFFQVSDAAGFADATLAHGVRFSVVGPNRLRAVTHLDVTSGQVDEAAAVVRRVAESWTA
ncbi:MAG: aminotransferase class I/II-fold pyridoxal phosphate-dependent enzyme [Spirochaetaceae bacterium]|nr:MAG: aminotransferase class I/II-fold pyridoxal phosphate-dependent enzyme [Spirochaetaceae bacterium]